MDLGRGEIHTPVLVQHGRHLWAQLGSFEPFVMDYQRGPSSKS